MTWEIAKKLWKETYWMGNATLYSWKICTFGSFVKFKPSRLCLLSHIDGTGNDWIDDDREDIRICRIILARVPKGRSEINLKDITREI